MCESNAGLPGAILDELSPGSLGKLIGATCAPFADAPQDHARYYRAPSGV